MHSFVTLLILVTTYNCDLENEAYRLAKYYCEHESQSTLGYEGINRAIIHNRAIGYRVAAINFQYEVQQWTKTAHPYNDSNSLKPANHEESELPFFVRTCTVPADSAECIVFGED
ncbi:hypothetical protein KIN20_024908 [Parelaphostrongylus tenuis]|uniref:SCP domain-containing protein n=1 Tax=Parelaphostrongylus tenuis TaxID=148309 RepID=A0AAD5QTZ4_PARTN|nr:hypothetical protein KIN20_024908 [Parelaphostrongylus tenuis]